MVQPREKASKIDWVELERAYINSDTDLYFFSREHTKNKNSPTLSTLQAKYYDRQWAPQREARIKAEIIESQGKTQAFNDEVVQVQILAREELLNANRAILQHIELAQQLQQLAIAILPKFLESLQYLDLVELAANKPHEYIKALDTFTKFLSNATEIERKAMGAADLRVEFTVKDGTDSGQSDRVKALKEMPQEDLIRSYMESLKSAN